MSEMSQFRRKTKVRAMGIGLIVTLLFFLLMFKSFTLQVVDAEWLQEQAVKYWRSSSVLEPQRGTITDRNGKPFAYEGRAYNVVAVLNSKADSYVEDKLGTAVKLAPILKMDVDQLNKLLSKDGVYQVELRPGGYKITQDVAQQVMALELPGIELVKTTKRFYPNGSFASHVLGYVNLDNEPVMGIEKDFNVQLEGKAGFQLFTKDKRGYQLAATKASLEKPENGKKIILTIDERIQQYVEKALDEAEREFHPNRMSVLVVDPNNMEILAMANRPHFNPSEYWKGISNYVNYSVGAPFEPGSTFKIVTLSAAVEEGLFNPEERYQSGRLKVPGGIVPDVNTHWGELTFLEGVQRSSNVAFAILGYERLQKERLFQYIERFGFMKQTGIEVSGEAAGGVAKDIAHVVPIELANISFGQGINVTAIQMVTAVSAVANGGTLLKPHIVKEIIDEDTGAVLYQSQREEIHRVISEETAKQVTEYLVSTVTSEHGTARKYEIPGYEVAGKTGTAQKIENGRYSNTKHIVSFIGYAPKDDPQLLVYVVVDEPQLEFPYIGSKVLAPIFTSVMQSSLQYLNVAPNSEMVVVSNQAQSYQLPSFEGEQVLPTKKMLLEQGKNVEVVGTGDTIIQQYPRPNTVVTNEQTIYLLVQKPEEIPIPDFTGTSLREVMEYTSLLGIQAQTDGQGYVIAQSIEPGVKIASDQVIHFRLQPLSGPVPGQGRDEEIEDISEQQQQEGNSEQESQDSNEGKGGQRETGTIPFE